VSHSLAASGLPLTPVEPPPEPLLEPLGGDRLGAGARGMDMILEGFLLHHGTPRATRADDPDAELLAGDFCYAEGLVAVAEAGDLGAIRALARLIALGSALAAEDRGAELAALWQTTARAIGQDEGARERLADAVRELADGHPERLVALADTTDDTYQRLMEALA
jgi:hypothetical protein